MNDPWFEMLKYVKFYFIINTYRDIDLELVEKL